MGNSWGHIFKITTWGESHGQSIGVVIDNCPPGISLSLTDIQKELDKRRPNQSALTTSRNESDQAKILSGTHNDQTLGTPITILVQNKDHRPEDYENIRNCFRPSHADYTYFKKYGLEQPSGGSRSSARETLARVAAGAIAKKILYQRGVEIRAFVDRVQDIAMPQETFSIFPSEETIEQSPIRCPHPETAQRMIQRIQEIKEAGDSVGGTLFCIIKNVPTGLGAPVFDKLEADLAKAMLSIPASKGFEIGSGFAGTFFKGSEHNDHFVNEQGKIRTQTNNSGGVQGGISNGETIYFRVAFKPTSTVQKEQSTVDIKNNPTTLKVSGRHDPCVLPRAVPIVEAMAALTLVDHWMLHQAQLSLSTQSINT